jgi:hypothetical protein
MYLIMNWLIKSVELILKNVCKHRKRCYICNRFKQHTMLFLTQGEILKRPTRADCKSAVKTSQVRILLSPQKKPENFQVFFMPLFFFFVFFVLQKSQTSDEFLMF